jgi:hypothetical protein
MSLDLPTLEIRLCPAVRNDAEMSFERVPAYPPQFDPLQDLRTSFI